MIHIHEMYELLKVKGYVFPPKPKDGTYMILPTTLLHTEEELEREDREIQSAVRSTIKFIKIRVIELLRDFEHFQLSITWEFIRNYKN